MKIKILSLIFLLNGFFSVCFSQSETVSAILKWEGLVQEELSSGQQLQYLYFAGASVDPGSNLPYYSQVIDLENESVEIEAVFDSVVYSPCAAGEVSFLTDIGFENTAVEFISSIRYQQKQPYGLLTFVPLRKNQMTGLYEKITYFEITINISSTSSSRNSGAIKNYAEHSVLQTGDWYKFKTTEPGVYRISYNDLLSAGIDLTSVDPRNIKLYGNGGGMLPEKNNKLRPDDLIENSIFVSGEDDGTFDAEDYILFYASSPHEWYEVLGFYYYRQNLYDDHCYFYLTTSGSPGKRIETEPYPSTPPNVTQQTFNDRQLLEEEKVNLIESGKAWYGDEFGEVKNRQYNFNFPHLVEGTEVTLKIGVANRTFINEELVVNINNAVVDTVTLTSVNQNQTRFAQKKKKTYEFVAEGKDININLSYLQQEPASRMWLDYIYVNARSEMDLSEGQLLFRDRTYLNEGIMVKFVVANAGESTRFWEVTDPLNPVLVEAELDGNSSHVVVPSGILREFAVFDGSKYYTPEFSGMVENQDLHGSGPYEYVIVTHPLFRDQANQIRDIHDSVDNFNGILVTESEIIYNEFSSGKQDPTAIRDLLKLYYDKFPGNEPKYLLLLGDGSFDPKERLEHNTNFVPTFQTEESWTTSTSYVVEDYFGLLDDTEGEDAWGDVDLGIGRIPVQTVEEAQNMVDKIRRYVYGSEKVFGEWKNTLCIIADDEDNNLHIKQADSLSEGYDFIPDYINQRKIYLDAFPQVQTPSGKKYPAVTQKINEQVNEGALIVNYIGHGGTGGWAGERIIQVNDIVGWSNGRKLPVFITATCEFSRFDEPEIISAGEWVLLNPKGGGIALMTTTRLAYSLSNFRLNERIYARAFIEENGQTPFLGDIIKYSKPPGQLTTRNFVLLGDPALRVGYPDYKVNAVSLTVNGEARPINQTDTLSSLQEIRIEGEIADYQGQLIDDFNGMVYPVLFDKPTLSTTLGNDAGSFPFKYKHQNQVLWKGKSKVVNGQFSVAFVVPKDMAQHIDKGKVSFYAVSETHDATGVYNDFILHGIDENAAPDNEGPNVGLFLNDTNFVSGDQTHKNPLMIAHLYDEHGINISTNGIGHNMTAVLDEDYSNIMVMNEYYTPDVNTYRSGTILFPFNNLDNGRHTLRLKVWDSYDNSTEKTIEFFINDEAGLSLSNVMNYPNPFSDQTTFVFRHTKPGTELNVLLEVFDLVGNFVMSYETNLFSENTELSLLTWDGRDVNGNRIRKGIYLYTLTVSDRDGNITKQQQKFIIK